MPAFAANLTFLFTELPLMERFAAAREAGFEAVEILFPYDCAVPEVRAALRLNELSLVLINTPPPNWAGGDRGFAAVPGLSKRFRHDFRRALRVARALGAKHLHVMAGRAQGLVAHQTFVDNLTWAADHAPDQSLTIEPINQTDIPGYFLHDFDTAARVLDEVGRPNLGLQFDTYHAQMIGEDVPAMWAAHGHRVVHVQIAGAPDRNEPGDTPVDHGAFFAHLDRTGYGGHVSAEYKPREGTVEGLGWLRARSAPRG